jgi:hypothetical protein
MAVANDKTIDGHVTDIKEAFAKCLITNQSNKTFKLIRLAAHRNDRKKQRSKLTSTMKKTGRMTSQLKGNVVNELMAKVLSVS